MIEIEPQGLGRRIARYRREARLTAAGLAERVGGDLTRETLAKIETGKRPNVSLVLVLSIAWALRVPPVALVVDLDSPQNRVLVDGSRRTVQEVVEWFSGDATVILDRDTLDRQPALNLRTLISVYRQLTRAEQELEARIDEQEEGNGPHGTLNASENAALNRVIEELEQQVQHHKDVIRAFSPGGLG